MNTIAMLIGYATMVLCAVGLLAVLMAVTTNYIWRRMWAVNSLAWMRRAVAHYKTVEPFKDSWIEE